MRGQQCSFHLCLWGHFAKKNWNVASSRHEPFSICQLSVFFPHFNTRRVSQRYWSRFLCSGIKSGVFAIASHPWALLPYTSILHNNLNTEIHFVICGTSSPSIIWGSMLVWELLHKVPWDGGILVVVVNLDH